MRWHNAEKTPVVAVQRAQPAKRVVLRLVLGREDVIQKSDPNSKPRTMRTVV